MKAPITSKAALRIKITAMRTGVKKEEQITIRVTPEVKMQLQELADNDYRKLADYIRLKLEKMVLDKPADKRESVFSEKEERIKATAEKINAKL